FRRTTPRWEMRGSKPWLVVAPLFVAGPRGALQFLHDLTNLEHDFHEVWPLLHHARRKVGRWYRHRFQDRPRCRGNDEGAVTEVHRSLDRVPDEEYGRLRLARQVHEHVLHVETRARIERAE